MDIKRTVLYHMMSREQERLESLPSIIVSSLNNKLEHSFKHDVDKFCAEESGMLNVAFLSYPREMKELLDLLDGNGLNITHLDEFHTTVVQYDRDVYRRAMLAREMYIVLDGEKGFTYEWE